MSETPGGPEFYTPPPQAVPTPPPPPSISDAAAQYENPYLAAPGQRVTPPADPTGHPGVYAAAPRPVQGLAITALVLGIIAVVTGWIPGWGVVVGAVAIIFGIVALAKRQSKGMAITGIVTGAVGAVISAAMVALIVFSATWATDPDNWTSYGPGDDDFFADGGTTLGPEPVDGPIHVAEQAFGPTSWDESVWWYVAILENSGDTPYVAADVTVKALDASGAEIDSEWNYVSLPTGQTAVVGMFYEIGDGAVESLAVVGPQTDDLYESPSFGTITTSNLEAVTDDYSTIVTGMASSNYPEELYGAEIVVVARDASGAIIAAAPAYLSNVLPGESVPFEAYFDTPLPAGTTYETYAVTY